MTAEGRSINVTLIFSLLGWEQVIDAYMSGLETLVSAGGDPTRVHGVASSSSAGSKQRSTAASRLSTPTRLLPKGKAAIPRPDSPTRCSRPVHALLANTPRDRGHAQRPLWGSTSTKNPDYADTRYVDELIGSDTVTTLTEDTITAFEEHGTIARTVDQATDEAANTRSGLQQLGIDLTDVGADLVSKGIERFRADYRATLDSLDANVRELTATRSTRL